MRRALLVLVAVAALVFPVASFAQVPGQDSVSLNGIATTGNFSVSTLTATSGPSGENPSGQVAFTVFGSLSLAGPVTCLAVDGNTATLNFQDQVGGFGITTVQVTDNQPDCLRRRPNRPSSDGLFAARGDGIRRTGERRRHNRGRRTAASYVEGAVQERRLAVPTGSSRTRATASAS